MFKSALLSLALLLAASALFAQPAPAPYGALPTQRQLHWQETEMYCIIHLGMAAYTDKEWGFGDEAVGLFNPVKFNALQVVGAAKAGGFRGIVVVAKHHDGFCLWPTKTTAHNIAQSPYKNGKGDMIREYRDACDKLSIKLGLYCSPWDRNNAGYGKPAYLETYRAQLRELYSNYGLLFMSWHDGANGGDGFYGGARETRKIDRTTYYDWDNTWGITRTMQPGAAIFGDVGPDVRWVGNEEGHAGETSWETYVPQGLEDGKAPSNGNVKYWLGTSGTRDGKYWMPAECDVPLRNGWFYHESQNGLSKSPYDLLDLYYKSVGRAACLDLGLSPDKSGQITVEDSEILKKFGQLLKATFAVNLAGGATFNASNIRGNNKVKYGTQKLVDNDRYSYWATDNQVTNPQLMVNLHKAKTFNVIRLRENIKLGQRIDSVTVEAFLNKRWVKIAKATSIGANRLIRLSKNVSADKLRIRIYSPVSVVLSDFGLFKEPEHLPVPKIYRTPAGMVSITGSTPAQQTRFTTDGSKPTASSPIYKEPFLFADGGVVTAANFINAYYRSEIKKEIFSPVKTSWRSLTISGKADYLKSAIDDNPNTFASVNMANDAVITIDMAKSTSIKSFTYTPRTSANADAIVDAYEFYTSTDGVNWVRAAKGEFANIKSNPVVQLITLDKAVTARYFKFVPTHVINGNIAEIAEIGVVK